MLNIKSDIRNRCYLFSINVIAFIDTLTNKRSVWVITDQLIRSSTSIGANLVEATAASSRLEYKKYFEIALKSANETKYWLGLLRDTHLSDKNQTNNLLQEVTEISKMLGSAVIKLKSKKNF
ncbi:hypothetical protein A2966_04600 [Candidatus Roizmanbacteria bacterium RIFCSPLOWO2_01_FULL_41_22]|uniref:Four helix bundle protein n=1 Tax=Candidatus Roizmanbacteria bacterium RIFCSPLOWO2_01_FULL_41_22 TaxID=1802067 RepID=A0A1F7J7F7_9BACT|nr:MAG: hypothetical protein A2966_04600 [Candidatus Roizmanbacteria bacterium RIFCSPLOWO2_01_FULL_41_22]